MARIATAPSFPRGRAAAGSAALWNRTWQAARFVAPIALIVAWEIAARSGAVSEFMLPPISAVAARVIADIASGDFFVNAGLTLYRTFFGFAIAGAAGIGLGIAMARSRWAYWFFDPIVSIGFPMPKIAFLPVFILWFGLYDASKVTIVAVNAIFPVITATLIALQGVEREIVWSAQASGASDRRIAWEIVVPAAAPQVITGLQVAIPTALIVCLVSEMMMGGYGLGGAMMESSRMLDSPAVFAGIVEIAVIGHCVITGVALIRRRLLVWHQETQQPPPV